jgi:endonuclease/exonuclease/phosphatase family metal-dependent hydrolase
MAANLTGDSQAYEDAGLRIFQGLKPDIVAIQEFNYRGNTSNDLRAMIDTAFGTNFVYYRETNAGYSIPNGIISRWPLLSAGSWEDADTGVNNRGFAWAQIDLPGTNDLFVVSVHLKASSGDAARRAAEAQQVRGLVQARFRPNAWLIVAGDCNIASPTEQALAIFKSFLTDDAIPDDGTSSRDPNTNNGRSERYDYVFPSASLHSNRVATIVGSRQFTNGLVFDSRVYAPLAAVAPVQAADSGMIQHMAVVKNFNVHYTNTNWVAVPRPRLRWATTNVVAWEGLSNFAYRLESSTNLGAWNTISTATSGSPSFRFTNRISAAPAQFFRLVWLQR